MIITETGILVSTDPNMRDPAPLTFKIEGGQVGDNIVRATGLTGNTTYYAQSYFVRDGMYIRQKGLTEFKTAAQAEVLKIKNAYAGSNTIGINKTGSPDAITLNYSTDEGATWNTWNSANGNFSVTLAEGGEVWLKGNNNRISTGDNNYYKFTSTETFDCDGNLSALIRNDLSVLLDYCFYNLFSGSAIRIAPDLPSIDLSRSCYARMFYQCASLTRAPMLPSTVLSNRCYEYMFSGCTSLTQAPALPATTLADSCYQYMFSGCTSLTQAPALPATTLANSCYYNMFGSCHSLTQAPALPATTLAGGCYQQMFQYCSSLTQAPALPATTIAGSCYRRMFYNCTSLAQAPTTLPATTLAGNCYYQMFQNCTSLTQAPALPATTLADYCYYGMFDHCSALTQAPPTLPATTLNYYCYYQMFYYCSSLRTAPVLYATSLTTSCYYRMFDGCSVLNKIICYATSWGYQNAYGWVTGVAPTGDFYNLGGANIPIDSEHGVPIGWTLHTSLHDPLTITNGESSQNTITLTKTGSPQDITLEYSTDNGSTWTSWSSANGNLSVTINANQSIRFRGNNRGFSEFNKPYTFGSTGKFSVSGNVMSLLAEDITTIPRNGFEKLFSGSAVTTVSSDFLSDASLSYQCFIYMFQNCTSLTQAPVLPATTLANSCYSGMFLGCTSLTQAPALPATTLANSCYSSMFLGCTSLTQAPALPATTMVTGCYNNMFNGCTALTQAPALPATTLADSCYFSMFTWCSSLTQAPALPATVLANACYQAMFSWCTSLTQAPALPATTLTQNCYFRMFQHCTSLNKIVIYASDISATDAISEWVDYVSSTGNFYNLGGATYQRGISGIPTGWTEHTTI